MSHGHRPSRIQAWLAGQLALLGLQILLGMAVNVWVSLPARHPGAQVQNYFGGLLRGIPWAFWHGGPLLTAHIALGVILWGLAIGILMAAWRGAPRPVGVWALVAWFGLTGAGFNGGSFVDYGHAVSSFLMTVGWVAAATAYAAAWSRCAEHA